MHWRWTDDGYILDHLDGAIEVPPHSEYSGILADPPAAGPCEGGPYVGGQLEGQSSMCTSSCAYLIMWCLGLFGLVKDLNPKDELKGDVKG